MQVQFWHCVTGNVGLALRDRECGPGLATEGKTSSTNLYESAIKVPRCYHILIFWICIFWRTFGLKSTVKEGRRTGELDSLVLIKFQSADTGTNLLQDFRA